MKKKHAIIPDINCVWLVCVDVFTINVTTEKNCEVRLKETKLDHEHAESYQLKIRLDTLAGVVNPTKSTTMVSTVRL